MNNQDDDLNDNIFNKQLLKIFIYLFYYEKYLIDNKEKAFDNYEKYYLINPQWLQNYKNYYNYENLYNFLETNKRKNIINYNNLEQYYEYIKDEVINNNCIYFEKKELPELLLGKRQINCHLIRRYDFPFIMEGIIFPSKILELIKHNHKNLPKSLVPKELFFINKYIIYINKLFNQIIIGNLNEDNLFIPKYVFIFNSIEKLEIEKNKILSNTLSINYCVQESIPIDNDNNFKILKNEKEEEIFKLIILIKNKHRNKSVHYNENKMELNMRFSDFNKYKKNYGITSNINFIPENPNNKRVINCNFFSPYKKKTIDKYNDFKNNKNCFSSSNTNTNNNIIIKDSEKDKNTFLINNNNEIYFNQIKDLKKLINDLTNKNNNLKSDLENKNKELDLYKNKYNELNISYTKVKTELEKSNNEINKYINIIKESKNKEEQIKIKESELFKKEENYNKLIKDLKEKENNLIKVKKEICEKMKEMKINDGKNIAIKNENSDLIKKNKEIDDKIKEKELKYKKIWNYDFIQNLIISMIGKIKIKNIEQKKRN